MLFRSYIPIATAGIGLPENSLNEYAAERLEGKDLYVVLGGLAVSPDMRARTKNKEDRTHRRRSPGVTSKTHKSNSASTEQTPSGITVVRLPDCQPIVPRPAEGMAVLITGKTLGRSDEELGEILVRGFLGALSQLALPPRTVALMNEGVKLALFDSSSCDHLKNLERKGTNILVCGTCVNHFGIVDSVGVGVISNMLEIVEALNGAGRILSL